MNKYIKEFSNNITSLHRYSKQAIAIITDVTLCVLCTWLAFAIRLDEFILFKDFNFYPALISAIIAIPIFWLFGLYRTIFRYTGFSIVFTILISSFIYTLLYISFGVLILQEIPRPIGFFQPLILFILIVGSRLLVKYAFISNPDPKNFFYKKKVLVYGAGDAGRQLVTALENSIEFKVVGFLDDNNQLHKQVRCTKTPHNLRDQLLSNQLHSMSCCSLSSNQLP